MTEPKTQAAHSGTCPSDCSASFEWAQTVKALDYFEETLKGQLIEMNEALTEAIQLRNRLKAWLIDHSQNNEMSGGR